jgi:DNA-binding GntR family transcriptional regulator
MAVPAFARPRTASEAVAAQIRQEIQLGELSPGSQLRQGEVATRLGVSTTPVREAFQLLQAEGLVRMHPHRGAIVFRPTADEVREAYEIREVLECMAIEKAMPHITPGIEAELSSLVKAMEAAETEREWLGLNRRFHDLQYEASGRPRLCTILSNIRDASSGYVHMVIFDAMKSGRSSDEHRQILNAIKARDVKSAQRAIVSHLHQTVEHVMRLLDAPEKQDGRHKTSLDTPRAS